ncbi:cardio acceleratory peptide 2b-like isoform X4 [Neodiprion fabricii]|uniref:cardio acceleratory peptide 2b-like isoform X4 n=1 Tax=Neodiprion fabricii TaxID=2872261 RepID=UPI001ED9053E|nr:cardio acceleratory peptide 2b-like isoform X4 [Neodiprion fabricii]
MKDTLSFVLVLLIATTSLNRGEEIKLKKQCRSLFDYPRVGRSPKMTELTRTGRAFGMINVPRVGRSDSSDYDAAFDLNYDDMSHEVKRQGLIPFPRVGRSRDAPSLSYANDALKVAKAKRTGDAVSSGGMWFGPRLGRLHRRGEEPQAEDQQWAILPIREFQGTGEQQSENLTPRLVRESDGEEAQRFSNTGGVY